jgi:hypothetical protein
MKQLIKSSILVFVAMCFSATILAQDLWDGESVATGFFSGLGTSTNPYEIRTAAQLKYFEQQVNDGNTFSGKTIRLMNDIDLGNNALEISKLFAGTFDGNGHFLEQIFQRNAIFQNVTGTIKHLGIRAGVFRDDRYPYYGEIYLVQTLESGGVVENCYYELSKKCNGYDLYIIDYRSFLVGSNSGTIYNCYAKGNYRIYDAGGVWGAYLLGMLVGTNNETGIVQNCAASTYNNGLNARGQLQPLITNNKGTLIEGPNTTLSYFAVPDPCTVEFIDLQFANVTMSKTVALGETVGELPSLTGEWSFIGWKRYGELVSPTSIVDNDWTLFAQWAQCIRKQPTANDMSVVVDDASHASFQWHVICGEAQQLGEWQSTNHSGNSQSSHKIVFEAQEGQSLEFDYTVSSEADYDEFTAYINGTLVLCTSGGRKGSYQYSIPEGGTYTLLLYYSKDDDTDFGSDMVTVEDIRLSAPDIQLSCTQSSLPPVLMEKEGFYYCVISYSNTSTVLYTDTIAYPPISILGDVNADNVVTPADAIMILYRFFQVEQAGFNEKLADVNGDGSISPADAISALYIYFNVDNNNNVSATRLTSTYGKDPD